MPDFAQGLLPGIEPRFCANCGGAVPEEQEIAVMVEGAAHCQSCVTECADCGVVLPNREIQECADGHDRCSSCSSWCEDCWEHFPNYDLNEWMRCGLCESHYTRCEGCRGSFHIDSLSAARLCNGCELSYTMCVGCGNRVHVDTLEREGGLCIDCVETIEEREEEVDERAPGTIQEYSYKPLPRFYRSKGNVREQGGKELYFGVELEVEACGSISCADAVLRCPELHGQAEWYCKKDGSLSDGVEVVSHPMTFEYIKDCLRLEWQSKFRQWGFKSYKTRTCGMHVHVSAFALSRLDIFKLLRFSKDNREFMLLVSRRYPEHLKKWAAIEEAPTSALLRKAKDRKRQTNRYEAINVCPETTIEFRLFRGTLETEAFLRNLAIVRALIAFVKEKELACLQAGAFTEWCRGEAGKYVGKDLARSLNRWLTDIQQKRTKEDVSNYCTTEE